VPNTKKPKENKKMYCLGEQEIKEDQPKIQETLSPLAYNEFLSQIFGIKPIQWGTLSQDQMKHLEQWTAIVNEEDHQFWKLVEGGQPALLEQMFSYPDVPEGG
jgi:hypothetical protein